MAPGVAAASGDAGISGVRRMVDLEITLTETPRHNWGIRGLPGDGLALDYTVEV